MRRTYRDRSFRIGQLVAVVAVLLAACVTPPASAQTMADRVPEGALVYVGWAGTDALAEQYGQSIMKQVMDADAGGWGLEALSAFQDMMVEEGEIDGEQAEAMMEVLETSLSSPMAMYVLAPDDLNGNDPPMFAVMWQAGDQAEALKTKLETLVAEMPPDANAKVTVADGLLTLQLGSEVEAGEGMLADADGFAKVATMAEGSALVVHVNAAAMVAIGDAVAAEEGDADMWERAKTSMGLEGIERAVVVMGFAPGSGEAGAMGWETQLFVEAPAPRKGLLSLLEQESLGDAELSLVPKDAVAVLAARFDTAELYDTIRTVADGIEPGAADQMDGAVDMAGGMLGSDLREDLIKSLGDTWVAYIDPAAAGPSALGVVAVNPLKDAEKVERVMESIKATVNQIVEQQAENAFGPQPQVKIHTREIDGVTIHSVGVPLVSPSFAVHDGKMYAALFPQPIMQAVKRKVEPATSIMANAAFMDSYKQVLAVGQPNQAGKPQKLWWVDLKTTAKTSYATSLMWNQALKGFGEMMSGNPTPGVMPPLAEIQEFLKPEMFLVWTDDEGLHARGWTPFPGASSFGPTGGLGGGGTIGVAALGVGILLPALGAADLPAAQLAPIQAAQDLAMAQHVYALDHKGKFADTAGQLVEARTVEMRVVVPADVAFAAGKPVSAEAINWHSVFTIVPDLTDQAEAGTIALFETPTPDRAEVAVAFADGGAAVLPVAELERLIKKQTGKTVDELVTQHRGPEAQPALPAEEAHE